MKRSFGTPGFTLVEVVLAIGVVAVMALSMLGLLPALTRGAAESADRLAAQRLTDSVQVELRRLVTELGFDRLASDVPTMTTPFQPGYPMAAGRDGLRVFAFESPPVVTGRIPTDQQFFSVELWRFSGAPLNDVTVTLAVQVRVSWPYCVPGSTSPVPFENRSQFSFNAVINR